ncbi:hypothetical protein [Sphingomonas yabuuchiae]|uniref:hypothetical protein n=1 Tax=Sphingomonas yabuuchiae TaxID=172044 RepID=UPI003D96F80E
MIATILLAIALPAAAPAPAQTCASTQPADHVAGRWIGAFAGADWTFELTSNATGWSGRYQSSRAPVWRPLEAVSVTAGCATFSLKSDPRVTFVVTLDAGGTVLTGDVQIAGLATLPFAAKRTS